MNTALEIIESVLSYDEVRSFQTEETKIGVNGQIAVLSALRSIGLPSLPADWPWDWTVTESDQYPTGKFGKRMKRYYVKEYGKIELFASSVHLMDNRFLERLGAKLKRNTVEEGEYFLSLNNEFDWDAGDFFDWDSCYWNSNKHARLMLKSNDAIALNQWVAPEIARKDYRDSWYQWHERHRDSEFYGIGRMWLAPYENSMIAFNAYGRLQTHSLVELLSNITGLHSNDLALYNFYNEEYDGENSDIFYINSVTGYALSVSPDELSSLVELQWNTSLSACKERFCSYCEKIEKKTNIKDGYCHKCFEEHCNTCDYCHETTLDGNSNITVQIMVDSERFISNIPVLCGNCVYSHFVTSCSFCQTRDENQNMESTSRGHSICMECIEIHTVACEGCGRHSEGINQAGTDHCLYCADDSVRGGMVGRDRHWNIPWASISTVDASVTQPEDNDAELNINRIATGISALMEAHQQQAEPIQQAINTFTEWEGLDWIDYVIQNNAVAQDEDEETDE